MEILITIQKIISWLLIIAVGLPFVRNDYWVFRILEYPRNQKFFVSVAILISLFFTLQNTTSDIITISLLAACVFYLSYKIWPYTFMAKKEMYSIKGGSLDSGNQVKLFSANVYQDNDNYAAMLQQIKENDPDVIFLLETNREWEKQMDVLIKKYPHCLKKTSRKYLWPVVLQPL